MRFAFIEAEKAHYPILVMCRVLEVSRAVMSRFAVKVTDEDGQTKEWEIVPELPSALSSR